MVSVAMIAGKPKKGDQTMISEFKVSGMHCDSCIALIRMNLSGVNGVKKVSGDPKKGVVLVETDGSNVDLNVLVKKIEEDGYKVIGRKTKGE
ncbi:MAG: heavy-metal-associated domain-containing protein [Candidatus Micrarchaeota archaeon]